MKTGLQLELRTSQDLDVIQDVFMSELSGVVDEIGAIESGARQYDLLSSLRDRVQRLVEDTDLSCDAAEIQSTVEQIERDSALLEELQADLRKLKEEYEEKFSLKSKTVKKVDDLWRKYSEFNYFGLFVFESDGFDIFMNKLRDGADVKSLLQEWKDSVVLMSSMEGVERLLCDGDFQRVVSGLKYSFPYENIRFSVIRDYMMMYNGEKKFGFRDVKDLSGKFMYEVERISEFCDSVSASLTDDRLESLSDQIEQVAIVHSARSNLEIAEGELKPLKRKIDGLELKIKNLIESNEGSKLLLDKLSESVKRKINLTLNNEI